MLSESVVREISVHVLLWGICAVGKHREAVRSCWLQGFSSTVARSVRWIYGALRKKARRNCYIETAQTAFVNANNMDFVIHVVLSEPQQHFPHIVTETVLDKSRAVLCIAIVALHCFVCIS